MYITSLKFYKHYYTAIYRSLYQLTLNTLNEHIYRKMIKNKKRGFLNNKATTYLIWFVLIEIILISMISIGFWRFLASVKDDNIFEKNYLARDIALTATAINSAPGDIKYTYNLNAPSFDLQFEKNMVIVSEPVGHEANYHFMSNDGGFSQTFKSPQKVTLKKENDKFMVENS